MFSKVKVPYAEHYNIKAERAILTNEDFDNYVVVGMFPWTYNEPEDPADYCNWLNHGYMDFNSLDYEGKTYLKSEDGVIFNKDDPQDPFQSGTAFD